MKTHKMVSGELKKRRDLGEFYTWARDTVIRYWSADTLLWHLSIDEMDLPYQIAKM